MFPGHLPGTHIDDATDLAALLPDNVEAGVVFHVSFADAGEEGPLYDAGLANTWSRASDPSLEPELLPTDILQPHLNVFNLKMIHEAGLRPRDLWDPDMAAQAFLTMALFLRAYVGSDRMFLNTNAATFIDEYGDGATYTDVIVNAMVFPPVETVRSAQVRLMAMFEKSRGGRGRGEVGGGG